MTATEPSFTHDPECDLLLERLVDVPAELVWEAWTDPEHIKAWFTPRPWQTVACEIDLRPGGRFATVMRDPEGDGGSFRGPRSMYDERDFEPVRIRARDTVVRRRV
jgi:uncharacterized protein YndB with AHSA1/START domain